MKFKTLSAAIVFAFAAQNAIADEHNNPHDGIFIEAYGDYLKADWDNIDGATPPWLELGESYGYGVHLGYRFNEYWSARLEYTELEFDIKNSDFHQDGERWGGDFLIHFNDTFYGVLGAKKFDVYDDEDFNSANIGVGFRSHFSYNWAVFGEANYYEGLNEDESDFGIKLGLGYHFGEKPAPAVVAAPVVVAAPKDSDGDGVNDDKDNCANTPMTDAVDAYGCTKYMEKGDKVELLVKFPHDDSDVNSRYYDDIQKVADFMNEYPDTKVTLVGHTSAVGPADYNMMLSEKRANHVAEQLIKDGVSSSRVMTQGRGEEELLDSANTLEAHAKNRRVEATIEATKRVKVNRK